ncbi:DNA-binding transcriptional LysR family regulator [Tumebacillus sp. BK434]|uniref:LysR family transcriptional regulator n=1 Tax=Tumebacillus sp. BK434 TaxID=2512169 RepID=UPI00104D5B53|nr:LysR family transcriptional regulator [Tumebacillus sp. BK434]TCP58931.1 DNA-binding transcriptional LysR family regulator [Tumebacillus sp. BK434]
MEIRQLNTFKVVAEVRGFTKAAEQLGYAQSSVTAQIQALEEELGTPLFDRLGKKILLTEAGARLLPFAAEMVRMHDAAKEALQSDATPSGTLTIGAPESLAAYRLPEIVREYRRLYPQVKFVLRPGMCFELRQGVRAGQLDFAFLLEPQGEATDLHLETLVEERMAMIAPPDHPFAAKERVQPEDLAQESFLHTEPGCSYRGQFEQYLQRHGVTPANSLEFWNIEAIKNCVMAGLGLSFLPLIAVESELREGKLAVLPWQEPAIRVATQLIHHKSKWLSPAHREFMRLVREHAQKWKE